MKNLMRTIIVTALLFAVFALNTEAKEFKGIITYKISYNMPDMDPQMASMMPKIMTYYISGNMSKTEISSSMFKNIHIIDAENQIVYDLYDMMGQKFYTKEGKEEIEDQIAKEDEPTLKFVDETKEIAGYECKKVIITIEEEGKSMTFNVYYAPKLGSKALNFNNSMFKDIDGALMEFEIIEGMGNMKMEAISVEKKKLKDSDFEIPEGYKETTKDEMRQNFGGGM